MKYRIYLAHSRDFDFQNDYYKPIQTKLSEHEVHVPHMPNAPYVDSRVLLPTCSLMIAEVSYPSTGLGMELIWANDVYKIPVLCIHKKNCSPSSSVKGVFPQENIISYDNNEDMLSKIEIWMYERQSELKNIRNSPTFY